MLSFTSSFVVLNLVIRLLAYSSGEFQGREADIAAAVFWRDRALEAPRCSYRRIDCYRRALDHDRTFFRAHLELAEVYYELGITYGYRDLFQEAALHLRKALDLDPASAEAHRILGQVCFLLRDFEGARRELEAARILEIEP